MNTLEKNAIFAIISLIDLLLFAITLVLSLKQQSADEESILIRYTKSHVAKILMAAANLLIAVIVMTYDAITVAFPYLIQSIIYFIIWMLSIALLRREYLKMGRTTGVLIAFWGFMTLNSVVILLADLGLSKGIENLRSVFLMIEFGLNSVSFLFVLVKKVDISNIYSRSSSQYNYLLKSYFIEDESLEEPGKVWNRLDNVLEKNIPIIQRENIKSILIQDTREVAEGDDLVVYYIIEVCYGKTRDLKRTVLRRYSEFLELYQDLKEANPSIKFPEFPKMTKTRIEVTRDIVNLRFEIFNLLMSEILKQKLDSPLLAQFLSSKPRPPMTDNEKRERIMSTIEETIFNVAVTKATKEETKFKTHAKYEVLVKCSGINIVSYHRFQDFKYLHKSLKKRHKNLESLPPNHFIKSSADPRIVKERKLKLENYLKNLLNNSNTKSDPEVISFLKLDSII
jgi:PX domain